MRKYLNLSIILSGLVVIVIIALLGLIAYATSIFVSVAIVLVLLLGWLIVKGSDYD